MNLFLMCKDSSSPMVSGESLDKRCGVYCRSSRENRSLFRRSKIDGSEDELVCIRENIPKLSFLGKVIWRFVLVIMALFFFSAAYVQHNDPDPYLWMPVYIIPFCVNVSLVISIPEGNWCFLNKLITCHMAFCYTLGFWTLAHYIHGRMTWGSGTGPFSEANMFAEEAKELLGLCLVIAWLSFVDNGNFLRFGGKGLLFAVALTALPIFCWVFLEEIEGDGCGK